MSKPTRAGDAPLKVSVVEGRTYFWCSCGRSARQPFCDGSHKDTGFEPVAYQAVESRDLFFCACKETANAPLCDGSHSKSHQDGRSVR